MQREMKTWAFVGLVLTLLEACTYVNRPQVLSDTSAKNPYVVATADMRFVFARSKPTLAALSPTAGLESVNSSLSVADPNFAICAMPSPNAAKALSDELTVNTNITGDELNALESRGASATVNLSNSTVENSSLSELGRGLATTRLLRDGVCRLCEAYCNSVISSTEYAPVLSRYTETMVARLAIEALTGMADIQHPASAVADASGLPVPSPPFVSKEGAGSGSAAGRPAPKDTKSSPSDPSPNALLNVSGRHMSPSLLDNSLLSFVTVADRSSTQASQDDHAAPPTPSSAATVKCTSAYKLVAVDAVIRVQENSLKQQAYAPVVVPCADTLRNTPTRSFSKNSMHENSANVFNTFIGIQTTRLTDGAHSFTAADAEKPVLARWDQAIIR
jgi:hypothetical protein